MGLAETASLIVKLDLQGNFGQQLGKANRALGTFDARLDKSQSRAFRAGQQIGIGIRRGAYLAAGGLAFLAGNVAKGLDSLVELEKQQAQTAAVLKSTGQVAHISAGQVGQLAEKYEALNATIGDEVIRSSENMLLTFTNVRRRAFEPTLRAILDLNTALGRGPESLTQTTIQVGKAMNDPIRGLTALRRVGVNFTKAQEKRIKALVKEGKTYEAQKVILQELNKEFGGSFAKQGQTTAGRIAKFKDSIDDLQRALAKALLPTLGNVADQLTKFLADPATVKGVEDLGKSLAGLFSKENLATGARILGDFFKEARAAAPGLIEAAKVAGSIVKTAVDVFRSLPPDIQRLAIGAAAINKLTGGLVTNLAGGLISAVLKQFSGTMNVAAGVVNVNGASGLGPGGGGGKLGLLGILSGFGFAAALELAIADAVGPAFRKALNLPEGGGGRTQQAGPITVQLGKPDHQLFQEAIQAFDRGLDSPALHNARPNTDRQLDSPALRSATNSLKTIAVNSRILTHPSMAPTLHPPEVDRGAMEKNRWRDLAKVFGDAAFKANIEDRRAMTAAVQDSPLGKQTVAGIDRVDTSVTTGLSAVKDVTSMSAVVTQGVVRGSSDSNASRIVGATQSQTGAIVSAIWAARPIINVTNITKTTTIQQRYGPSNGSYGTDSGANPGK